MWLMTTYGFFSAIQSPTRGVGWIQVRARSRADLVRLLNRFGSKMKIIETMQADYPFRIVIRTDTWSRWLAQIALESDKVTNFKGAIKSTVRHDVYLKVWSVLQDIENEPTSGLRVRPVATYSLTEPNLHGWSLPDDDDEWPKGLLPRD